MTLLPLLASSSLAVSPAEPPLHPVVPHHAMAITASLFLMACGSASDAGQPMSVAAPCTPVLSSTDLCGGQPKQTNCARLLSQHRHVSRLAPITEYSHCPPPSHTSVSSHSLHPSSLSPLRVCSIPTHAFVLGRSPSDDPHPSKRRRTPVHKRHHLMELSPPEISIQNCRPENCRKIEQHELCRNNNLNAISCLRHLLDTVLTLLSKRISARFRYLIWPIPVPTSTCVIVHSCGELLLRLLLTAITGYVIQCLNMTIHSMVSNVDIPFVASTVKPPYIYAEHRSMFQRIKDVPKSAHRPTSTYTHCRPARLSERLARKIAHTMYTIEYTTNTRCETASMSASGERRVSDGLDESTTVTAPRIAIAIPIRSRLEKLVRTATDIRGMHSLCGSARAGEEARKDSLR
jgi:hypothetical protein